MNNLHNFQFELNSITGRTQLRPVMLCLMMIGLFTTHSYAQADQSIEYASYFGGSENELPQAVAHSDGNYCIAGFTFSSNNIAQPGAHQDFLAGAEDGYIALFDESDQLIWSTYFGGASFDNVTDVAFDGQEIVVCGRTGSLSGIATPNAYQTEHGNDSGNQTDGFIARFSADGNLQWATYLGGAERDELLAIATDTAGNILVSGYTSSVGIATTGAYQTQLNGGTSQQEPELDGLIGKFTQDGDMLWSTYFGGVESDAIYDLATTPNDELVVVGSSESDSVMATSGAYQSSLQGIMDGFMARFSSGGMLQAGTYLGAPESRTIFQELVSDMNGRIYISGTTSAVNLATPDVFQETYGGGSQDNMVACFTDASQLDWFSYWGDDTFLSDEYCSIALTPTHLYLAKGTEGSGFSAGNPLQPEVSNSKDMLVAKITTEGSLNWATYLGGNQDDSVFRIAVYDDHRLLIGGFSRGFENYLTSDAYQSGYGGDGDNVIVKMVDETVVGLSEAASLQFSMYPNPANNTVQISVPGKFQTAAVTIYDSVGRAVLNKSVDGAFTTLSFDLSKGVYLVEVETPEGKGTQKLVVQ